MILQSRRVWILNSWLEAQIEICPETGRISCLYPYGEKSVDEDFGELRVVPGFIDVHTHGACGFDTNDADEEGLRRWARNVVREGVTGFLPTTVTQSEEVLTAALRNVAKVVRGQHGDSGDNGGSGYEGAQILGIHLEGPYLDQKHKGAQPEQYCVKPDAEQFERFQAAAEGLIRIVTMACEHDEMHAFTRSLAQKGIVVSLGHSSASYEQAAMAFANGARSVTHVYNGMDPFHHRDPGIVGAAMRFRNVFGEIICDGRHSSWGAVNTFFTAKGPDYGILITDSLCVKGLPEGTRTLFGGNLIELCEDGTARLVAETDAAADHAASVMDKAASTKPSSLMDKTGLMEKTGKKPPAGKLAGSTLKVNEGLRNLVERAEVPWQTAINACTINPARLIGMEARKGSLQAGKDADIVVLNDDYSAEAVFVGGKRSL